MVIALLLHITLALPPTPAVPPATLRAAAAEAAALWERFGVTIDAAPCDSASDEGIVLILVPVVVKHWRLDQLTNLDAGGEAARDRVLNYIERVGRVAQRMGSRRSATTASV